VDEVSVPVVLLEEMFDTVTSAYFYSQTIDLQETYKKMLKTGPKQSKMTEALAGSQKILEAFIELAKEEPEEGEDAESSDTN
jgi:hypothetical protein